MHLYCEIEKMMVYLVMPVHGNETCSYATKVNRLLASHRMKSTLYTVFRHNPRGYVRVLGGDTEFPLQVCQLTRSSESAHLYSLHRGVALFDSTRAPDGFCDPRHVPPIYFLTIPNIKCEPYHIKPTKIMSIPIITGLSKCGRFGDTPVQRTRPWVEDAAPQNPFPHL